MLAAALVVTLGFFSNRATSKLPQDVRSLYLSRFRPFDDGRANNKPQSASDNDEAPWRSRGPPRAPTEKAVSELWNELVKAYGSQELALLAASKNPTVLNPLYTSPPQIVPRSKAALVGVMGSEEGALEIMELNPAILQCGAALSKQEAAEIRTFAVARAAFDKVPRAFTKVLLGTILFSIALNIVLRGSDDPTAQQLSSLLGPALGSVGGSIFAATAINAARTQAQKPDP